MRAEELMAEIGDAMRRARARRGLSQRALAEHLGLSKSRINRLENRPGTIPVLEIQNVLEPAGFSLFIADREAGEWATEWVECPTVDAQGRRPPAHARLDTMGYPPAYWFLRNGGWLTREPFPEWTWHRLYPEEAGQRAADTVSPILQRDHCPFRQTATEGSVAVRGNEHPAGNAWTGQDQTPRT